MSQLELSQTFIMEQEKIPKLPLFSPHIKFCYKPDSWHKVQRGLKLINVSKEAGPRAE